MELFFSSLGLALVVLLCICGLVISCLSISGTWLVVIASILAAIIRPGFPGLWTIAIFVVVAALIEGVEVFAGAWGVKRRGGSSLTGVAAVVGGLAGLFLGSLAAPVVGSLLGMMVGSFTLAFAVEYIRTKRSSNAATIATGAVIARLLVVLLKVGATLVMTTVLILGMITAMSRC